MSEFFFILTTVFVAYVVYTIRDEQKVTTKSKASTSKVESLPAKPDVAVSIEKPAQIKPETIKTVKPKATATQADAPKVASVKPLKPKSAATKKTTETAVKSAGLKDPISGEIATSYSNYRFTKRWIKEALVAEGLLEKIYAANELNVETDAKIKEALGKLEAIDKYKA